MRTPRAAVKRNVQLFPTTRNAFPTTRYTTLDATSRAFATAAVEHAVEGSKKDTTHTLGGVGAAPQDMHKGDANRVA